MKNPTKEDFEKLLRPLAIWTEGKNESQAAEKVYELAKQMQPKWIPVSETPKESNVLVAYEFGSIAEAKYWQGKFVWRGDWTVEFPNVTHFMPLSALPEPPTI